MPGVSGIDMMGLNNRVVAKTLAQYPIDEAARAARDYVLSNLPGAISTYGYWRDDGGVHTRPSVGWFFAPYLESRFFAKNYAMAFADSEQDDRLLVNVLKVGFRGTPGLKGALLAREDAHRDKLMDGFHIEDGVQVWASPRARVLVTRTDNQQMLMVAGYLPDISRYPSGNFVMRVATTERYVGDRVFVRFVVRRTGQFVFEAPLPDTARTLKHVMLDFFGSRLVTSGEDVRELSWVLDEIALQ
jgi:hypothetical protein